MAPRAKTASEQLDMLRRAHPGNMPTTPEEEVLSTAVEEQLETTGVLAALRAQLRVNVFEAIVENEDEGPKALAVREAPNGGGVTIAGLSEREVSSIEAVVALTREGTRRRMTAATNMNEHSSRSHMLLSVHVATLHKSSGMRTFSKLHLVDLAGSERINKSRGSSNSFGRTINLSFVLPTEAVVESFSTNTVE